MTKVVPNHCNCLKVGEQSRSMELFISDFQNQGAHESKSKFTKNWHPWLLAIKISQGRQVNLTKFFYYRYLLPNDTLP